jgi:hypothetical protein
MEPYRAAGGGTIFALDAGLPKPAPRIAAIQPGIRDGGH